ncbi:MAG: Dabb family protein [Yoonia sp.]|uniref:Dabb family protein n=1 Tax=Yoonia sp. TaxID=2212373 RepID=UPI00273E916A|nr:Dabb family protein [Yoonia sp.]MDP5086306.1 Dabb family protein [Yoonia sp.]
MIKHIVLLDLPAGHDSAELGAIMTGLDDLRGRIPGFTGFEHGPNRDFEGMSPRCAYSFLCHFEDETTSRAYLVHPTHIDLGQRLAALCKGGAAGITVVDMAVSA